LGFGPEWIAIAVRMRASQIRSTPDGAKMRSASPDFTRRQKTGILLFVIFGPLLTEASWQYATSSVFAGFSWIEIAGISALGGAIAGWVIASKPAEQMIAAVCGAITTFGISYAFHRVYGTETTASASRVFVYLLGALPGIVLGTIGVYFARKGASDPPVAAA
jgi:hypothetical protein